ncbi:MAG: cytochrome b/b6 domain-containing protein, partial [Limnohabitans sp.]
QSRLSVAWRKLEALKELKNDFQNFPEAVLKWNAQTFRKWTSLVLTLAAFSTFLVSIFITLSGYAIYNEITGDWMSEIHEFLGNFLFMAVLLHIGLVMLLVLSKKSQGLRPMWSGRREGAGPDVAQNNHVWVAILLGMAVVSFLFFQLT